MKSLRERKLVKAEIMFTITKNIFIKTLAIEKGIKAEKS
jgi:hypothetical protein